MHREYVKITKDYALAAAESFATLPPDSEPFRFIYVSGEGTTFEPGRFTPIYARVKGETEIALSEMRAANPRLHAESVRPGMVDGVDHVAIKSYVPERSTLLRATTAVLGPPIRAFRKNGVSPTEPLGRFLTEMAMGKYEGKLTGPGIQTVRKLRVIENVGFRRLYGLSI